MRRRGGDRFVRVQIDVLIFQAAPKSFDEDVVDPASFAVHADRDAMGLEHTGELTALVTIEDFRLTVSRQRFFEGLNAEVPRRDSLDQI